MSSYLDKTASLTPTSYQIICHKATEPPFSCDEYDSVKKGTFLCRRCGIALFRTETKFASGCGWPSFDEDNLNAIKDITDADGIRTEILCKRCNAHLGHVFTGENFTATNKRYCVNGLSLDWVEEQNVLDSEEAIVAGGCFWGVDYFLNKLAGVLKTESGYSGGHLKNPCYEDVCRGDSGHYEAVRVIYDPSKTNYQSIIKRFFEIHDPTQQTGQGPDIGQQYQSAIFYYNEDQKNIAEQLMHSLRQKGYKVATQLKPVSTFWPAETYHQDYYLKSKKKPYCHAPVDRFST